MNAAQHARAKAIFMAARAMPVERQSDYLDEACDGDITLRAHVARLLAHDSQPATEDLTSTGTPAAAPSADAGEDLASGDVFADRYQIIARLGAGGMGTVYRANDKVLQQEVALKLLSHRSEADPGWLDRFKSEVRLAREISHPHVCRVYDIGFVQDRCYLSMEYIGGDDLRSLLKRVGRVPADRARKMALQITGALGALHRKGVLHRDLKPANVMIDEDGGVRLTDFGLATRDKLAGLEAMAGTPAYMSPEQITGQEVTQQSDLYALGLVLYELFTGQRAYQADSFGDYKALHTATQPVSPSSLVDDMPQEIEAAIQQCLAKDPAERPSSADALAMALGGDVLSELMQRGETPSPTLVAAAGSRQAVAQSWVFGAAALCVLLLGVLAWWVPDASRDVRQQLPDSPVSRADEARALSVRLAGAQDRDDRSWGVTRDDACHFLLETNNNYAVPQADHLPTPLIWHRNAPDPLAPQIVEAVLLHGARGSPHDPPPTEQPGATILVDPQGMLLGFERVLAGVPERTGTVDWQPFFEAAGLDGERLQTVETEFVPRVATDTRYAWELDGKQVRAGSLRGIATLFVVLGEVRPLVSEPPWRVFVTEHGWTLLFVGLLVISGPLAWRNLHRGRSDPRGARRLAAAIFCVRMFRWLLMAHHSNDPFLELRLVLFAAFGAFGAAGIAWLYYVALEPYLRRFWPHTLVSWTRVLAGRVRDPLVGWHVLLGIAIGLFFGLLGRADLAITELLGLPVRADLPRHDLLLPLLGARYAGASVLQLCLAGLSDALALLLMVALLRAVIRQPVAAGVAAVVFVGLLYIPRGSHPVVSTLLIGVLGSGIAVWLMTRIGLLSLAVAFAVSNIVNVLPIVLDLRHWSADVGVLTLLALLGATGWAVWHASGTGRAAPAG